MRSILCAIALSLSGSAIAAKLEIQSPTSKITWHAEGVPAGALTIDARAGNLEGTLDDNGAQVVSGSLKVPVASFATGIDKRDEHMKSSAYMDAATFPFVFLRLADVKYTDGSEFDWKGMLVIKDLAKPVSGKATYKGKHLVASFTLNRKDYDSVLKQPRYLGVGVDDKIDVTVEADVK